METQPDLSWSEVTAKGLNIPVVRPSPRLLIHDKTDKYHNKVVYRDPLYLAHIRLKKITAAVKQNLTRGSVIFYFASNMFVCRTEAYRLIEKQVGPFTGVRCLSQYGAGTNNDLILEVLFETDDIKEKACESGVTVGVRTVLGTPTFAFDDVELVEIKLNLLRIVEGEDFHNDLMESLKYYGEVLQVVEHRYNGFFEGDMTVLLDVNCNLTDDDGDVIPNQPLANNLYLTELDCYATASYKGANRVCHWCGISGHIRDQCPVLSETKCFSCREKGHTAKFCKKSIQKIEVKSREIENTPKIVNDNVIEQAKKQSGLPKSTNDKLENASMPSKTAATNGLNSKNGNTISDQQSNSIVRSQAISSGKGKPAVIATDPPRPKKIKVDT